MKFIRTLLAALPLAAAVAACPAVHAQMAHRLLHDGNISFGGTGQFSTVLESNPNNVAFTGANGVSTTVSGQRQDTTWSAGFVSSLQLHPLPWAGMQINYGFTHYQERYTFNYSGAGPTGNQLRIPVDWHEATAGYLLHPKHIPFQPYMVIGGGAIDFSPYGNGSNNIIATYGFHQWRGAGLLEAGFDLPVKYQHVGFRLSARSLYYRSPNFGTPQLSTRSWRVTTEPEASVFLRF